MAQYESLLDHLERGQLVLFLGPDFSAEVTGLPSRAELARLLTEGYQLSPHLTLSQAAKQIPSRDEVIRFLRTQLDTTNKGPKPFHQKLIDLVRSKHIRIIISLAYDDLLTNALSQADIPYRLVVNSNDARMISNDRLVLIQLYGNIHRHEDLIINETEHNLLSSPSNLGKSEVTDKVRQIFRENTIYFLGYNLSDPDFQILYDQVADHHLARHAYALWPNLPQADRDAWLSRKMFILDQDPLGLLTGNSSHIPYPFPPPSESPSTSSSSTILTVPTLPPELSETYRFFVNQKELRSRLVKKIKAAHRNARRDKTDPIITITGLGGIGKTALAVHLAHDLKEEFPGGIIWVSLQAQPDAQTIWNYIVKQYGARPAQPGASPDEVVQRLFYQHSPLLILDNAEAAPDIARQLLAKKGAAVVLVTTRDSDVTASFLNSPPEEEVGILPRAEAFGFFRGVHWQNEEEVLGEVCDLLGCLPLALKTVASYIRKNRLPLTECRDRLRELGLFELEMEQRAIQGVSVSFDLSWDKLSENAQCALRVLALGGGKHLSQEAFESILTKPLRLRTALDELAQYYLVDPRNRFSLHPLVQTYAQTKTEPTERHSMLQNMANYYLVYAQSHRQPMLDDYKALNLEFENIQIAMNWADEQKDWLKIVQFPLALRYFLEANGYWIESRKRLEKALVASEYVYQETELLQIKAELELALGLTLSRLNEWDIAEKSLEYSRLYSRKVADRLTEAKATYNLGLCHKNRRGNYETSLVLFHECLEGLQQVDGSIFDILQEKRRLTVMTRNEMGNCYSWLRRHADAQKQLHMCLSLYRDWGLNDQHWLAYMHQYLGIDYHLQQNLSSARQEYATALTILEALGISIKWQIAELNTNLGEVEFDDDNFEQAQEHFAKAIKLTRQIQDQFMIHYLTELFAGLTQKANEAGRQGIADWYTLQAQVLTTPPESKQT